MIFDIPHDNDYTFRQSYFIPYLLIAIPVFTRSFQFSLFKYFLNNEIVFVILAYFFFPHTILFTAILIYSIKNKINSFIIYSLIILIGGGLYPSLQIALMQIILFIYFIIKININIKYIGLFILTCIIVAYFIPESRINLLTMLDPNAGWRLSMWVDNITSTTDNTFLFGHGFGTPYFSIQESQFGLRTPIRIADDTLRQWGGNKIIAMFVLPQHNSFINIYYRLGAVGLLLFFYFLNSISKRIKKLKDLRHLNYILLFSIIIIGVNVGLESPGYATQFVFLNALVLHMVNEYQKNNCNTIN